MFRTRNTFQKTIVIFQNKRVDILETCIVLNSLTTISRTIKSTERRRKWLGRAATKASAKKTPSPRDEGERQTIKSVRAAHRSSGTGFRGFILILPPSAQSRCN